MYVHKSFILVIGFKKILNIFIFSIIKMAAKYAEICRVGKLEAGFQQVPHFQKFWAQLFKANDVVS